MKLFATFIALILAGGMGWNLLQSPESLIKKKTQKIIALASAPGLKSEMSLISKVSKMAKYIHFDVQVQAEYDGRSYSARSLNEFRSLLFSYFKHGETKKVNYENLSVHVEGKREGEARFFAHFEKDSSPFVCKALFQWVKEEKTWLVKKMELSSCRPKNI